uniref:Sugar phosphate transporter domain-containing protein n=1 Tax=Hemiselmis tepida TaxID=464990 RepID=A0A7S0VL66_9CRYP
MVAEPERAEQAGMMRGLTVVVAYGVTSFAITMVNKVVMSSYGFSFEMTLLLCQLLVGTSMMMLFAKLGLLSLPPLDPKRMRQCVPLTLCFFVYVLSGLGSLRSLSVPTWAALRRLTCLFILVLDHREGKPAPARIWASVGLMLVGALVAAHSDIEGTAAGYAQVLVNCVASAQYLREVGRVKRAAGLTELGVLLYTNVLCIPVATACIFAAGEHVKLARFEPSGSAFWPWLGASATLAGLLNYLVFLSATVNSPLTTSVAGQVKNVAGSLGGYFLLPSAALRDPAHLGGILLGLCASMWYASLKYRGVGKPAPQQQGGKGGSDHALPGGSGTVPKGSGTRLKGS